jgi:SulP family sulfate permease
VLDLKNVIYVVSTGAEALENLAHTCSKQQMRLIAAGLTHQPHDIATRTSLLELLQKRSTIDIQPDATSAICKAITPASEP